MSTLASRPVFLTPTYGPDVDRCRLMLDSLQAVGGVGRHVLVVQTEDLPAFAPLRGRPGVGLLAATADVLTPEMERWRCRSLRDRGPADVAAWLARRRLKGWFAQQLVKLLAGRALGLDTWVNVDSDCVFLRPPVADDFTGPGGSPAVFEFVDFPVGPSVRRFHQDARAFLRLPDDVDALPTPRRTYVQQLIPMHREPVERLIAWAQAHHRGPWWAAMARHRATEYTTYGLFLRHVAGLDGLTPVDRRLVRLYYAFDPATFQDDVRRRFAESEQLRAVMVHSTLGVDVGAYAPLLRPLVGEV